MWAFGDRDAASAHSESMTYIWWTWYNPMLITFGESEEASTHAKPMTYIWWKDVALAQYKLHVIPYSCMVVVTATKRTISKM